MYVRLKKYEKNKNVLNQVLSNCFENLKNMSTTLINLLELWH